MIPRRWDQRPYKFGDEEISTSISFLAVPAGGSTTQRRLVRQGYLAGSGPPDRGGELDKPLGQAEFPA
jgi:hypothetical protein